MASMAKASPPTASGPASFDGKDYPVTGDMSFGHAGAQAESMTATST